MDDGGFRTNGQTSQRVSGCWSRLVQKALPDWIGPESEGQFDKGSNVAEKELDNVLREVAPAAVQGPAHRPRGDLIGPGGAAKPQVNAAGMQCRQRAELLGDQQRRMVRQHDPAGADANVDCTRRDMGECHCRRSCHQTSTPRRNRRET